MTWRHVIGKLTLVHGQAHPTLQIQTATIHSKVRKTGNSQTPAVVYLSAYPTVFKELKKEKKFQKKDLFLFSDI